MARTALPGRLIWRVATVVKIVEETPRARTIALDCPDWPGHRAGQHVDVRLTAEDGYQAQRSYSIASSPEASTLALTVDRIDDGEVSPYLTGELGTGDLLELRGPIGNYFVWDASLEGPLLLLAGGSGIVPLMAMLRHRSAARSPVPTRLLYSARGLDDVIYRDELDRLAVYEEVDLRYAFTREWPEGWKGHRGRVDEALLRDVAWAPERGPRAFVCGPTGFVETIANGLVSVGYPPDRVKTERFG
jgi:ferredoxin-NADP reductase